MELIRGIHNIRAHHRGCVLTIGNFDGVHRGHQALLTQLKREGQRFGLPVMVMIFEPQPLEFFLPTQLPTQLPSQAPWRLTRLRDKVKYLAQAGIDYLLCVNFGHDFAAMSAEAFINELLVKKLAIKRLAVGDDFRFGASRLGDFQLLQRAGIDAGFSVIDTDSLCDGKLRISSTAIRRALAEGSLAQAEVLLGHRYSISGRVARGAQLGRAMGFPTANLALKRFSAAVNGVYLADVYGFGLSPLPGVVNIGTRPTVASGGMRLEVQLLDVTLDLYGQYIDVVLRAKLRDEQHFPSLDALKQQIARDVMMARRYFGLETWT